MAALALAVASSNAFLASVTSEAVRSAPSLPATTSKLSMMSTRPRFSISMPMVGETCSTFVCRSSGRYHSLPGSNIRSISTCGFMAANFSTSNSPYTSESTVILLTSRSPA